MGSYRSTAKEDRAKALAGVLLVHVALGAVILTGLNVRMVQHARERLGAILFCSAAIARHRVVSATSNAHIR